MSKVMGIPCFSVDYESLTYGVSLYGCRVGFVKKNRVRVEMATTYSKGGEAKQQTTRYQQ